MKIAIADHLIFNSINHFRAIYIIQFLENSWLDFYLNLSEKLLIKRETIVVASNEACWY